MTPDELNRRFGIGTQLQFREIDRGIVAADVTTAQANARIALQGAQVLAFQPRGADPVFWMAEHARLAPGASPHGGVPICWPWFGPHATDASLPIHGFARTVPWEVVGTAARADGTVALRFGLVPDRSTRAMWPHACTAQLDVLVGGVLRVELTTVNTGDAPFTLGEALHGYFHISDVSRVTVRGLEGCAYRDKVRGLALAAQEGSLAIDREVDRVYLNTAAECVIEDAGLGRAIHVAKEGSRSTVVWNPWIEKEKQFADFGPGDYRGMLCVEVANALDDVLTLPPSERHHVAATYRVEALAAPA